jgi:site-specific DNA-cytosine methylase
VDFFCGGGGAGTGLEIGLGRKVNVAKNNSAKAISMHTINHPGTKHFTTDVFDGDPDTECGGKAVGWFHMSPDCTHHSQADGGQPRKREIRNLSWIGLKWAGKKTPPSSASVSMMPGKLRGCQRLTSRSGIFAPKQARTRQKALVTSCRRKTS